MDKTNKNTDIAPVTDTRDDLPALSPECQTAWNIVNERVKKTTQTYTGLRYLLAGYTYRESAKHAGLQAPATLRDAVKRLGIQDAVASTNRAISQHRIIRQGAQEILIAQLESGDLDQEKAGTLGIVMGIADDKVRAHEEKAGHANNALAALQAIGQRLVEAGTRIDIAISPVPAYGSTQEAATIDVTPDPEPSRPQQPDPLDPLDPSPDPPSNPIQAIHLTLKTRARSGNQPGKARGRVRNTRPRPGESRAAARPAIVPAMTRSRACSADALRHASA